MSREGGRGGAQEREERRAELGRTGAGCRMYPVYVHAAKVLDQEAQKMGTIQRLSISAWVMNKRATLALASEASKSQPIPAYAPERTIIESIGCLPWCSLHQNVVC